MKLFEIAATYDGPPPEFGMTIDIIVVAHDEEEALKIAKVDRSDLDSITEKELTEPFVVSKNWR